MDNVITSGGLSMLVLEAVKWVAQKITKNPDFNFEPSMIAILLAVFNALAPFALVYVFGIPSVDPVLTMTLDGVAKYLLTVVIGTIISLGGYTIGLKPLKDYNARFNTQKALDNGEEGMV